jgi:hypothetical protein
MVTESESIPTRSAAGLAARDIFFTQFNEVNFYVEDNEQENLYLEILGRLFPRLRITQIFGLGGKANLLKHARDPVNAANAGKSVYILDKDFDDLLGHVVIDQPNVFYLDRYSIENYLVEEQALVQIALESNPRSRREDLRRDLAFKDFYAACLSSLKVLCAHFFAVQRFALGIPNAAQKMEAFSKAGKPWEVDPLAVAKYTRMVTDATIQAKIFSDAQAVAAFLETAIPRKGPRDANVCGKFLLTMAYHYLRHKASIGNVTLDSLRYRLSRNNSFKKLRFLRLRIADYLMLAGVGVYARAKG